MNADESVLVAGAGGFIGGHVVRRLKNLGVTRIRAVDIKPVDEWHQVHDGVENMSADLSKLDDCRAAAVGMDRVSTSPQTWAVWATSRRTRQRACCRC